MVDWTSKTLEHNLICQLVDPLDLSSVMGYLEHVEYSGTYRMSINSNSRASASISVVSPFKTGGWDKRSAIKLLHYAVDEFGNSIIEPLFTGFVDKWTWNEADESKYIVSFELVSPLYILDHAGLTYWYILSPGNHAVASFKELCDWYNRLARIDPDISEVIFSTTLVYNPGEMIQGILYDLADAANSIITLEPDGYIRLRKYVKPESRQLSYVVDDSIVLENSSSGGDSIFDNPDRIIVYSEKSDDSVIGISAKDGLSFSDKGFIVDKTYSPAQIEPFTDEQASRLAKEELSLYKNSIEKKSKSIRYIPLSFLDILGFREYGKITKWSIISADLDFSSWTWSLSLEGGWSE